MGMFSWECRRCEKSLLGDLAINEQNAWMNKVVALLPNGDLLKGSYDGYGRVAGADIHNEGEPEVYHQACWVLEGRPLEFTQASEYSADQGWFYDEEDYALSDPSGVGR